MENPFTTMVRHTEESIQLSIPVSNNPSFIFIQHKQKSPKPSSSKSQITQIETGRYIIFKKKTPGQPRIKVRLLQSNYNDSKELIDQLLEKL